MSLTVHLFGGPGGWEEGARLVGVPGSSIGVEWDPAACATALAAGHDRYCGDLSLIPVDKFGPFTGLVASPPCPSFSTAGKGLGKLDMPRIMRHLDRIRDAGRWLHYSREGWHDPRSPLVLEPVRWALEGRPEWIALEQVPAVLPFWKAAGSLLGDYGYLWSAGNLSAEQFGVPQTRKRAILVAHRTRTTFRSMLPLPTHQGYSKRRPFDPASPLPFDPASPLPRWVSMAEALGWGMAARPYPTVAAGTKAGGADAAMLGGSGARRTVNDARDNGDWLVRTGNNSMVTGRTGSRAGDGDVQRYERPVTDPAPTVDCASGSKWTLHAPATTVQGDPRIAPRGHHDRQFNGDTVRVSVDEAARLQSFRPDYPWNGGPKDSKTKKFEQIGNAIPPLLAAAVLGNLLDLPGWRDVCMSMRPEPAAVEEGPAA